MKKNVAIAEQAVKKAKEFQKRLLETEGIRMSLGAIFAKAINQLFSK